MFTFLDKIYDQTIEVDVNSLIFQKGWNLFIMLARNCQGLKRRDKKWESSNDGRRQWRCPRSKKKWDGLRWTIASGDPERDKWNSICHECQDSRRKEVQAFKHNASYKRKRKSEISDFLRVAFCIKWFFASLRRKIVFKGNF